MLCQINAALQNKSGTWRAFLSDSNQEIKNFFSGAAASLPVHNINGQVIAASWTTLLNFGSGAWGSTDVFSFNGTEVEEAGGWSDADAWHGSNADGSRHASATCSDWTSTSGSGAGGEWDMHWLFATPETNPCSGLQALGCILIAE